MLYRLFLKDKEGDTIEFEPLIRDCIITIDNGNIFNACVILDETQINQLITHLTLQLQSIGVEVDILKK